MSCAGLLHDIGNPPFGHVGEEIIREWFKKNLGNIYLYDENAEDGQKSVKDFLKEKQIEDLENFEGNAQALRILTKARHQSGINLPFSIISALIKYPTRSGEMEEEHIRHKLGCYQAENDVFEQCAEEVGTIDSEENIVRHPLAYLVEAADDIAYMTADLEDAVKAGVFSVEELIDFFESEYRGLVKKRGESDHHVKYTGKIIDELISINSKENDKTKVMSRWGTHVRRWLMYVACWRFSANYDEIITGTYPHDLFYNTNYSLTVKLLRKAMKQFVFDSRIITEPELSAQTMLEFLLDKFVPAVVKMDGFGEMTTQDKKVLTLISENYLDDYNKVKEIDNITDKSELIYRRILIATDFISGMTDGYARALYRRISGVE